MGRDAVHGVLLVFCGGMVGGDADPPRFAGDGFGEKFLVPPLDVTVSFKQYGRKRENQNQKPVGYQNRTLGIRAVIRIVGWHIERQQNELPLQPLVREQVIVPELKRAPTHKKKPVVIPVGVLHFIVQDDDSASTANNFSQWQVNNVKSKPSDTVYP